MVSEGKISILLFWLTVAVVMVAQFALCYEALVCRGYPPLSEMGMYKKWASPFLIWIPAVFGNRVMRLRGLAAMSLTVTFLFVMIEANGMMRPSIGHLAGVSGILSFHFPEIIVWTPMYYPLVFLILYSLERVFGDLWRALWLQPTPVMSFADTWKAAWTFQTGTRS